MRDKGQDVVARYGVDGVMIGRAGLDRPWLFRQAAAALAGQPIPPDLTPDQQRTLLLDHYRRILERFGPIKGTILMRRYACCYARGCPAPGSFASTLPRPQRPRNSSLRSPGIFRVRSPAFRRPWRVGRGPWGVDRGVGPMLQAPRFISHPPSGVSHPSYRSDSA